MRDPRRGELDEEHGLRGPGWVETAVRDVTALGGVVVLTMVTALICVAMTERPATHHASERFASRYPSTSCVRFDRRRPSTMIQVM